MTVSMLSGRCTVDDVRIIFNDPVLERPKLRTIADETDRLHRLAPDALQRDAADRILHDVVIQRFAAARDAPVLGLRQVAAAAAVDRFGILLHPAADLPEDLHRFRRDIALCVRTDIQKHIAVLAHALDELFDDHFGRLEVFVLRAVAPVVVHRDAGLPADVAAAAVLEAGLRDDLLRADIVAAELERLIGRDRTKAAAAHLKAVVENNIRL